MKNSITLLLTVMANHTHGKLPQSFTMVGVSTTTKAQSKCNNCGHRFSAL